MVQRSEEGEGGIKAKGKRKEEKMEVCKKG